MKSNPFENKAPSGPRLCILFAAAFPFTVINAQSATYYIDYSGGSDANNGTATNTAWKRHPNMNGWADNYAHAAGDRFVFKRGVTWPATTLTLQITVGGTAANPDVYTSIPEWGAGPAAFATFDCERNVISGRGLYLNTHSAVYIDAPHVTFSFIEVKNLIIPTSAGYNAYQVGSITCGNRASAGISVMDCYVHSWKPANALGGDSDFGGIVFLGAGTAFHNTIGPGLPPDGYSGSSGCGVNGGWYVISNNISGVFECINSSAVTISYNDLHDCPNSFASGAHANVIYKNFGSSTITHINNNKIHNVGDTFQTMLLHVGINGATNTTTYIYNNIIWYVTSPIVLDDYGITRNDNGIVVRVFNNIIAHGQCVVAGNRNGGLSNYVQEVDCRNNIWISGGGFGMFNPFGNFNENRTLYGNMTTRVDTNNLWLLPADATALGWTAANQWQTPLTTSTNVGLGLNLTSLGLFTNDVKGNPRPTIGAWDIGAYQYKPTVSAPRGLKIVPQ